MLFCILHSSRKVNHVLRNEVKEKTEKNTEAGAGTKCGGECGWLHYLAKIEDLAEKKSKIYSRLFFNAALAQDMERLAVSHAQGKKALLTLAKKEEA